MIVAQVVSLVGKNSALTGKILVFMSSLFAVFLVDGLITDFSSLKTF